MKIVGTVALPKMETTVQQNMLMQVGLASQVGPPRVEVMMTESLNGRM